MPVRIDFSQITFAEPVFLWLLVIPALLLALWIWRLVRRRMDIRSPGAARARCRSASATRRSATCRSGSA